MIADFTAWFFRVEPSVPPNPFIGWDWGSSEIKLTDVLIAEHRCAFQGIRSSLEKILNFYTAHLSEVFDLALQDNNDVLTIAAFQMLDWGLLKLRDAIIEHRILQTKICVILLTGDLSHRVISRVASMCAGILPGEQRVEVTSAVLLSLLSHIGNIEVYYLVRWHFRNHPTLEPLHESLISQNLHSLFVALIQSSNIEGDLDICSDKVQLVKTLYALIVSAFDNPILREEFCCDQVISCLQTEYQNVAHVIIDEQWHAIESLTRNCCSSFCLLFMDYARHKFAEIPNVVYPYFTSVIQYMAWIVPLSAEFGEQAVLERLFVLMMRFQQHGFLQKAIRVYIDAALLNDEVRPRIIDIFTPTLLIVLENEPKGVIFYSAIEILSYFYRWFERDERTSTLLNSFPGFNPFVSSTYLPRRTVLNAPYGGPVRT